MGTARARARLGIYSSAGSDEAVLSAGRIPSSVSSVRSSVTLYRCHARNARRAAGSSSGVRVCPSNVRRVGPVCDLVALFSHQLTNCTHGLLRERWSSFRGADHFVSTKPLLERLELMEWPERGALQWVIVGGESGSGARPMDRAWARDLRDQPNKTGVGFSLKQLGGVRNKRGPDTATLDGEYWRQMPVLESAP